MPLAGFSRRTGRWEKTILLSDIAGTATIDNSSGGLTAADAAESSCRFPSGLSASQERALPERTWDGEAGNEKGESLCIAEQNKLGLKISQQRFPSRRDSARLC